MNQVVFPRPCSDIADVASALNGRKVLITGATGFIGGRLLERVLVECGAQPRAFIRGYGRAARLARFGLDKVELFIGSLSDPTAIKNAVKGCAVVFHCAYDRADLGSNKSGMQALIDACIEYGARLVHVSTFSVYEPLPDGDLFEDIKPVRSGIPYAETKLDIDELILEATRTKNLDATIVLPTIVYGPNGKSWTLLPANQLKTGTVVLPANGEGLCNAVYIDDICQGMIRAAISPKACGKRYLLSGPRPVTWTEFFQAYADALALKGPQLMNNDELKKTLSNPVSAVRLMLGDPKRVLRWPPVRTLAMKAKSRLTPGLKLIIKSIYSRYRRVAPPPIYVPASQVIALYSAKCNVLIDGARADLDYNPAYDFKRGMRMTGMWLRWAMPAE